MKTISRNLLLLLAMGWVVASASTTDELNPALAFPPVITKALKGKDPAKVTVLHLMNPDIRDEDLASLKLLPQLRILNLTGTQVSDAGLAHLKPLTKLQKLHLSDTRVSDAGLEYLKPLTKMRALSLDGTRVTRAGADELQEHLPRCQISRLSSAVAAFVAEAKPVPGFPPGRSRTFLWR